MRHIQYTTYIPLKVPLQYSTLSTTTIAKIHQYIQRKDQGFKKFLYSSLLATHEQNKKYLENR